MAKVYLNGEILNISEAKISPMDRGFLFGDGIYEVIPSYSGQYLGFKLHVERLYRGLKAIEIPFNMELLQLKSICDELITHHEGDNVGVYLHVSRGVVEKRHHGYDDSITPTLFIYTFDIAEPPQAASPDKGCKVNSQLDERWDHRDIKSTALLGNVLHYQKASEQGLDETLLFNEDDELTEAAACNVFIVKDGVVSTPALDHQKLPGITRSMLINILTKHTDIEVIETVVTKQQVQAADEIWLTSSSRQLAWVEELDGKKLTPVSASSVWTQAQAAFTAHQFDFE